MNKINKIIILFFGIIGFVGTAFSAQSARNALRGIRPLVLRGTPGAVACQNSSDQVGIREGSSAQALVSVNSEEVIEQVVRYYNRFLSLRVMAEQGLKNIEKEPQLKFDAELQRKKCECVKRAQQAQNDCEAAKEEIDKVCSLYFGAPKQEGVRLSEIILSSQVRANQCKQVIEQAIKKAKTQEAPCLKVFRDAEFLLPKPLPSKESDFMIFMGGVVNKAQIFNAARRINGVGAFKNYIGLLTPLQIFCLCKNTEMQMQAELPKQPANMGTLTRREALEDFPEIVQEPKMVSLSHHIGQLPLQYKEKPLAEIPATEKNSAACHFKALQENSTFIDYLGTYENCTNSIMNMIYGVSQATVQKPRIHTKSYLLASLGIVGGLFAHGQNMPLRWASMAWLGGLGLGSWALGSDIKKQNLHQRKCKAFNQANLLIEEVVKKNPTAFLHLDVLNSTHLGITQIFSNNRLAVS